MALVSMFLCNQSYASHGRDFLLGATILNFDDLLLPFILGDTYLHARHARRYLSRERKFP